MTLSQARLRAQLVAAASAAMSGGRSSVPEAGRILWGVFAALSGTRSFHANGANPISYAEIEAYCRLTRTPLGAEHIAILRAMDDAWLATVSRRISSTSSTLNSSRAQPLTAAAFDAAVG